jgi:hypothetical protein
MSEFARMSEMTKLLQQAVEQARKLPEDEQDAVADALFACMAGAKSRKHLSPEQVEEVKRIRADLPTGQSRLASDEEVATFWQKYGV